MGDPNTSATQPQAFPCTRWSLVLAATRDSSPESLAALETVCRSYWYPLYAYVRRCGQSPHDAQDITQEFFRLLLEKRWLTNADREKGRLRSFLISALKHFMSQEWRRASAQKRGGGQAHVLMDTEFAESRYADEAAGQLGADQVFDRQWAVTLLDLTLRRLEAEFAAAGKAADYEVLKGFLAVTHEAIDYGSAAERLGVSAATARVAVHRLRKRFRELYRQEVSQTLPDGANLDAELRYLTKALAEP